MTKPAKPGSFRWQIESRVQKVQGFEDLEHLLRKVNDGNRADYLLFDRNLIVEQKEYLDSPQHRARGKATLEFSERLIKKYGVDPDKGTYPQNSLSSDEVEQANKFKNTFYDKIKDQIHKADRQIGSTKKTLQIPDATGAVLLIFDKIPGIMPYIVHERVLRVFELLTMDNKAVYPHVDFVIFCIHLRDMLYNGRNSINGRINRSKNDVHIDYARKILDALKEGAVNNQPRTYARREDVVQQLRPNLFDE